MAVNTGVNEYERHSPLELVSALAYIFLTFFTFYCECYKLPVGVKYFINIIIAAWAAAAFLINPKFKRMKFCLRFFVMYYLPFVFFWVWSMGIWLSDFQTTDYIIRGSKNIFYMFTTIAYICAAFYLFGKKAVDYTFYSMAAANLLCFVKVGLNNGFGNLLSEYAELITSFANVTGETISKLELHTIVLGWGVYVIYFILHWEKPHWKSALKFLTALFFFTLSLKRVGVAGVAAALLIGIIFRLFSNENRRRMIIIVSAAVIGLAFAYVVLIKTGVYNDFAEHFGINLMGRDKIMAAYDKYYEISPAFMGRGIRFVFNHGQTTGGYASLHNVFVEHYIELGFFGWFVWMIYDVYFRCRWVGKNFGYAAAEFLLASIVYAFITYATDNSYFYFSISAVYRLLSMSWCFESAQKHGFLDSEEENHLIAVE